MSGAGMQLPFVSVLLPVRNEARDLKDCLATVLAQDYPRDRMEVLVADGMSEDGTRDQIQQIAREDPRVRLVDNPGRIVPTGLNAAIRVARGEVIVRVDGHTLVAPDYVSQGVAALGRTGADVVGGNMTPEGRAPFGRAVAVATSTPMGVGGSRFHYAGREEAAESVYMGTFRRDVFARFGGFNEGLVRNQDDEFNYRVREKGGRVWLVPSMRSRYFPRETPVALFRQYLQYGIYKVRVAALHPRMLRLRHLAPSVFVAAMGVLLLAAPFSTVAAIVLLGLLALHASASLALSWDARREPGTWMRVPIVNLILHVAYGAGFIGGCLAAAAGRLPGAKPGALRSAP